MATVKYDDLAAAFDFVSFAAPMEHHAYISLDTGAIYWISELNPLDEEVPDDLETSDRYLAVPHKNDLELGSSLALDFAAEELSDQYARVDGFFQHRGAYARFKELLGKRRPSGQVVRIRSRMHHASPEELVSRKRYSRIPE